MVLFWKANGADLPAAAKEQRSPYYQSITLSEDNVNICEQMNGQRSKSRISRRSLLVMEARSMDEEVEGEATRIGKAIHAARKKRHWSIKDLSAASRLSGGMISQIERGISLPSLKSLIALAAALDVPIARFFSAPPLVNAAASSIYVVHKNERRQLKLTPTGLTKQHLVPELPGMIEMYEVKLTPGGSSGPEFFPHPGEKAGLVLTGTIRLWIDEAPSVLEAGDGFRFPSDLPHRFDNYGSTEAHLIWIALNAQKSLPFLIGQTVGPSQFDKDA
jgi:transcriptional regulator with XRE-family HTH domain